MSTDPSLGKSIHMVLIGMGIETPMSKSPADKFDGIQSELGLREGIHKTIASLGLDMSDDSIKETPDRIFKMYTKEVFYGLDYKNFPKCTTITNKMSYDEVIMSDGIDVLSFCEHHFVPFIGHARIAYIPKTKVLGLSKFNRVVDFFSRRPQVQERLTEQIHAAFKYILDTDDIGVVIQAQHMCVRLRGVRQANGTTTTSKLSGRFRTSDALRAEFMALTKA